MHPLLYLASRQVVNGVRRALTSARRMIGILFFVSYYFFALRPITGSSRRFSSLVVPFLDLPPARVIEAIVFSLFGAFTVLSLIGLTNYRGGHRQADIDVLFPTPVSPRQVLLFRMVRDSLINLVVPMFIVVLAWRPTAGTWASLVEGLDPSSASLTLRLGTASYLILAAGWVAWGYAASLYVNRSGEQYDRLRKAVKIGLGIVIVGVLGWLIRLLQNNPEGQGIVASLSDPVVRGVLFLPHFASKFTLAPLTGDWTAGLIGFGVLLTFTVTGFWMALRQADWLYEIAAQRVGTTVQTTDMMRRGDSIGVMAEHARAGRVKARRFQRLSQVNARGVWALVWKDLITSTRGFTGIYVMFPVMGIAVMILITASGGSGRSSRPEAIGVLFSFMIGMMTLASAGMASQGGFIDLLNRVDLLKPLPYKHSVTMFFEVIGKSIAGILTAWVTAIAGAILQPASAPWAIGAAILAGAGSILVVACTGLTTLLFPDIGDPSQRGFRGLVQMLVLFIFGGPPAGIFLGLALGLKWSPMLAAVPAALAALGLAFLAATFAGNLFASYNPSE